jgi:hypothetical protein
MKETIKKLNDRIDRKQRHKNKRKKLVGEEGMHKQNMREAKAKAKAAVTPGKSVNKAKTMEAVKRVGEYKEGKFKGFAKGGKTSCRGMGAATSGGRFRKDG